MKGAAFSIRRTTDIRSLAGWQKSYRIPDQANLVADQFVHQLAQSDLDADLDEVFQKLKTEFRLKRKELESLPVQSGTGGLLTPFFQYQCTVNQSELDPSKIEWHRSVDQILNLESIQSSAFKKVFRGVFDTFECDFPKKIILEDFIDRVEEADIPDLKVHYGRQVDFCDLELSQVSGTIRLTDSRISVFYPEPQEIARLFDSFQAIQKLFMAYQVELLG